MGLYSTHAARRYTTEAKKAFSGRVFVPDDLEKTTEGDAVNGLYVGIGFDL